MNEHSLSDPSCAACAIASTINRICAFPGELPRWFDSNAQGWAPLFLRVLLAYEFGEAGLEMIAPVVLILGLATRFFSLALILLTVVAIAAVHWPAEWHCLAELRKGYAITDQGYGNFKLLMIYVLMLSSLVLSGSGQLSIDAWIKSQRQPVHR